MTVDRALDFGGYEAQYGVLSQSSLDCPPQTERPHTRPGAYVLRNVPSGARTVGRTPRMAARGSGP